MKNQTLKIMLVALVLTWLSGCSSMKANIRAMKSSVVRVAGMEMPNSGGLGPSYAIVGENNIVLPTDQQYLMVLKPYMPKFMGLGFGSYRFVVDSNLLSLEPSDSSMRIKPLGFAKSNRLLVFYVVSANKVDTGKMIKAKVKTDLVQSVDGGEPVGSTREDIIKFSVTDVANVKGELDAWQKEVLLLQAAPKGARDLGVVEVSPGKLIMSDILEPYSKLKDEAKDKGANIITDLELITKQEQEVGLSANFGFRAHAWKVTK